MPTPLVTPTGRDEEFETRLRIKLEHWTAVTPAMLHSIDENGLLMSVSDAWLAKLGYARDEVLGRRSSDFLTAESREHAVRNVLPEFFRLGRCENVQYQMVCKDGSVIDVFLSAVLDNDTSGRGRMSRAVITDVTTLKETKRQLAESEARYRFLAENSTDLILLVGADGRRTYASAASKALLGYEPEEMLAIRSQDAIHPDDTKRVLSILANGWSDGRRVVHTVSYRLRHKDGGYVWVETTGQTVDIAGERDQRLVIIRNIEQRMRAEQRLRNSEARYRLLADNSTDMVLQLDQDLVRRYVSPACRELLGYEPEEMIGIKPVSVAHPDDAPRLSLVFQTLMSGRADRQSIISRIRHRDGRWIWVEAQFRALRDPESGAATGIIGSLRDVSARKIVEDELAEANRRLQALAVQDGLTGLANRRAFDEALAKEHRRARREKKPLSLVMIDVDRFKAFNDRYGHPAGDDCLRRVAAAIAETAGRPGDIAARYGGEEFAVLLPDTDEATAEVVAERILQAVGDLNIRHEANFEGVITISAGVASVEPAEVSGEPEALIHNADQALYRAKDGGRNAVIRASTSPVEPFVTSPSQERLTLTGRR